MNKPIPYKGPEPYIFISYAHKDSDRVWPIIDRMLKDGYRVWYDEGIDPGTEWDEFIASHIENCSYFIAFLSANYMASDNCKDELNFVRDLNKHRLLIHLEDHVQLPAGMRMRLGRLQAIHWYTYTNRDEAFSKLYSSEHLDTQLGDAPADAPAAPDEPELSDAECSFQQGEVYYGIGDFHIAASYYIPAAEQGHLGAQLRMGYLCQVDRNFPRAFYWYLQAALQGHAEAMCEVGNCYANGHGVKKDPGKAAEWYRKAGESGHADACFQMGKLCVNEVPPAYTEALTWFRKAQALGHPQAEEWVASCQTQLDRASQQAKLRIRAAQGDAEAQYQLAKSLSCQDKAQAFSWHQRAADQGHLDAIYEIGMCYYLGAGVAKDITASTQWLLRAAETGHTEAMFQLSELYQDYGDELEQFADADDEEWAEAVIFWLTKAARQGHEMAQYTLALDYEYGECVEEDMEQAVYWHRKAAEQGCASSRKRLEELGEL